MQILQDFKSKYTPALQLLVAFAFSLILAPLSYGIVYFIIFLIVYEIALAWWNSWRVLWQMRLAVLAVSVFGFLIGRLLVWDDNPLEQMTSFSISDEWSKLLQLIGWSK